MVIEYGKLDTRYWQTKDPCVMLISYMELIIMGPLCILWYSTVCVIVYPLMPNRHRSQWVNVKHVESMFLRSVEYL